MFQLSLLAIKDLYMTRNSISLEAHQDLIGKELGVSDWVVVTQDMIDKFADCTLDHQFIHVDVERSKKETPYGGTIAHGFLSVSLLSYFSYTVVPGIDGMVNALNYGFDKLRFMSPVKSGKRIRARFTLSALQMRGDKMVQRTVKTVVEIEGEEKPALMAEWLGVIVLK